MISYSLSHSIRIAPYALASAVYFNDLDRIRLKITTLLDRNQHQLNVSQSTRNSRTLRKIRKKLLEDLAECDRPQRTFLVPRVSMTVQQPVPLLSNPVMLDVPVLPEMQLEPEAIPLEVMLDMPALPEIHLEPEPIPLLVVQEEKPKSWWGTALKVGLAVVGIGLVIGGVMWWRSRSSSSYPATTSAEPAPSTVSSAPAPVAIPSAPPVVPNLQAPNQATENSVFRYMVEKGHSLSWCMRHGPKISEAVANWFKINGPSLGWVIKSKPVKFS